MKYRLGAAIQFLSRAEESRKLPFISSTCNMFKFQQKIQESRNQLNLKVNAL